MQKFHVVTMDDSFNDLTPENIERIEAGMFRIREVLNSPIELIDRAIGLLKGTAEKIAEF
jgi:hypothetical protein